jgi:predicted RNase H-related nuclease YkuK (DUF458 family)
MLFKRLSDHENIDLIEYVRNAINVDEQVRIYIGTDSHNRGNATVYGTVVVIHYGNRGGHVIYYKESVPKIKDTFSRLWKEVDLSVRVAEMLKESGVATADYIDLDYNPDPKYRSNSVLRSAVGYVESMGYVARTKPYSSAASCVADFVCH